MSLEAQNVKLYLTPSVPPRTGMWAQNMKMGPDTLGIAQNKFGSTKHENGTQRPRYSPKRGWKRETGLDALGTIKNEFGSAKYENGIRRPRYRRKWVRERKTWKLGPTPSVPPKMDPGAQNMKTTPDALGTTQDEYGSAKHENWTWRPRYSSKRVWERKTWKRDSAPLVLPKTNPEAQNLKTGPNTLFTVKNESRCVKHKNWTRCPRFRPKQLQERNTWKRNSTPSVLSKKSLGAQNMKMGPGALSTAKNDSGSTKYENRDRRPRYRRKWVYERKTWKLDLAPSVPPETDTGAQYMKTGPDTIGTTQNESGSGKHEN
jgi:hypothetical protein